jgi:hypothetical protein
MVLFVFAGNGFSQDMTKDIRSLLAEKYETMSGTDSRKRSAYDDLWISKNPDDVKPLAGTTWELSIHSDYGVYKDELTFIGDVETTEDGYATLLYMDEDFQIGTVVYTEFPDEMGGGRGFVALTAIALSSTQFYYFKTDRDRASGYWTDDSIFTPYYPLEGKMTDGPLDDGYIAMSDMWLRAVIRTDEAGPVNAVFYKGGEKVTGRGDKVVWGYFYADPSDVSWGDEWNPEVYVKIWADVSGRTDVNFFHVSVPEIEVYSAYPYVNAYDKKGTATMDERYVRHEFQR